MIISQEKAFLKAQSQLQQICHFVEKAAAEGQRIDEVERELFAKVQEVGLTMLNSFVAGQGDGDEGAEIKQDEQVLRRLKQPHTRRYLSHSFFAPAPRQRRESQTLPDPPRTAAKQRRKA